MDEGERRGAPKKEIPFKERSYGKPEEDHGEVMGASCQPSRLSYTGLADKGVDAGGRSALKSAEKRAPRKPEKGGKTPRIGSLLRILDSKYDKSRSSYIRREREAEKTLRRPKEKGRKHVEDGNQMG